MIAQLVQLPDFIELQPGSVAGTWLTIMVSSSILCFVVSEITRNYSQVDKLWSIMPVIYSIITLSANPTPRLWVMTILVSAWGLRLSYNFSRKGGYNIIPWKGEEDYRWKIMQQKPALKGRLRFGLFNLLFISFYQHFLIMLFSTPILLSSMYPGSSLTYLDALAASLVIFFLVVETVADNQQARFQKIKHGELKKEGVFTESLTKGFLSEGLWTYVRHPNFSSEQGIWLSFYLFGVSASGKWLNWTLSGSLLLVLLFIGSTILTEQISSEKYKAYAEYRKQVPKLLPSFSKKIRK